MVMGDDGRDGDEASHGTLSLSPPGTRVIASDRRSGCYGDRKGGQNARKVYIGQAGQIADVAVVRARRLTRFSTGGRLAQKNGEGKSLHMYELHAQYAHGRGRGHTRPANAATGPPPGSRSRYQKYCVVAASGSEERRPCVRCGASRACGKTELGMAGSGCLWQTPFCSLRLRRSSLPFSPILSALSPPLARWLLLHPMWPHCTATRRGRLPPSLPPLSSVREPNQDRSRSLICSSSVRICARSSDRFRRSFFIRRCACIPVLGY